MDGNLEQRREVGQLRAANVAENGQLGQVDVDVALARGNGHQLAVVCPFDVAQPALVVQGGDRVYRFKILKLVDSDAADEERQNGISDEAEKRALA